MFVPEAYGTPGVVQRQHWVIPPLVFVHPVFEVPGGYGPLQAPAEHPLQGVHIPGTDFAVIQVTPFELGLSPDP